MEEDIIPNKLRQQKEAKLAQLKIEAKRRQTRLEACMQFWIGVQENKRLRILDELEAKAEAERLARLPDNQKESKCCIQGPNCEDRVEVGYINCYKCDPHEEYYTDDGVCHCGETIKNNQRHCFGCMPKRRNGPYVETVIEEKRVQGSVRKQRFYGSYVGTNADWEEEYDECTNCGKQKYTEKTETISVMLGMPQKEIIVRLRNRFNHIPILNIMY